MSFVPYKRAITKTMFTISHTEAKETTKTIAII